MKKSLKSVLLMIGGVAAAMPAYAQNQSAPSSANPGNRSQAEKSGQSEGFSVGVTHFALRPTAGAVFFNGNQRFTGGLLVDFNILSTPYVKIGPATGALYSSISGNTFFDGMNPSNSDYFFQIPANLKLMVQPEPSHVLSIGAHGGANIIRSTASLGGAFGGTTNTSNLGVSNTGASWDVHPNVGADIDVNVATNAAISLRPDLTLMPDFNMVTATLGLAVQL